MADHDELKPDPTAIGDVSAPPLVKLPERDTVFLRRAERLRQMAVVSPLKPFLNFVADMTEVQHEVLAQLPQSGSAQVAPAGQFGMPQLDRVALADSDAMQGIFDRLFAKAKPIEKPASAVAALKQVASASANERRSMIENIFAAQLPADRIAEHIYVWAALQVQMSHEAALLDAARVQPVADGVCPVCGGLPSSSMVVDWKGAHGARFCSCALCNTLWHYVRVKCVCCGSTKGIGFKEVEDGGGVIKAETCDTCMRWVKIIYQLNSTQSEAVADDVATLGIDMMMRDTDYQRGGFAPWLAGL